MYSYHYFFFINNAFMSLFVRNYLRSINSAIHFGPNSARLRQDPQTREGFKFITRECTYIIFSFVQLVWVYFFFEIFEATCSCLDIEEWLSIETRIRTRQHDTCGLSRTVRQKKSTLLHFAWEILFRFCFTFANALSLPSGVSSHAGISRNEFVDHLENSSARRTPANLVLAIQNIKLNFTSNGRPNIPFPS